MLFTYRYNNKLLIGIILTATNVNVISNQLISLKCLYTKLHIHGTIVVTTFKTLFIYLAYLQPLKRTHFVFLQKVLPFKAG